MTSFQLYWHRPGVNYEMVFSVFRGIMFGLRNNRDNKCLSKLKSNVGQRRILDRSSPYHLWPNWAFGALEEVLDKTIFLGGGLTS